jgi:4-alpha-glucanotransferase
VEKDLFAPAWYRDGSRAYGTLNDGEKRIFGELVSRYFRESEADWSAEAEKLLGFMKETTHMLPCAEDLGVVPDCVPVVLGKLGILSLKIPRWAKKYKEPGEPYIPPRDYPFLSVCAASVHDTTTLRDWWEHEADREAFWGALGYSGTPPRELVPEAAERLFEGLLATGSALAMSSSRITSPCRRLPDGRSRGRKDQRPRYGDGGELVVPSSHVPRGLEHNEDLCLRIRNLVERRRSRKAPPRG